MGLTYPDQEGYAYAFERAELNAANRVLTALKSVKIDQPTEEGVVMGTRSYPLKRTPGNMGLGEGTMEFSDEEERQVFLDSFGDTYRETIFSVKWILKAKGKPNITYVAYGCRVLNDGADHSQGSDALGGEVTFSFMSYTRNGKVQHSGQTAPNR